MNQENKAKVLNQYVNQYLPVIESNLSILRSNSNLRIPYCQFLFSTLDYFGFLYNIAHNNLYSTRGTKNMKDFLGSKYFPNEIHKKIRILDFIRNGVMHQIFPKASSLDTKNIDKLFHEDLSIKPFPALNLIKLENVIIKAITLFIEDVKINSEFVDNLHNQLFIEHPYFDDHKNFNKIIQDDFNGNINNLFS